MTRLPTCVCTACGRGFTTAKAARRHVINVEHGNGYVATEADYRTAIITGMIPPPVPKLLQPMHKKKEKSLEDIRLEEFVKGYWRKVGEKAAEDAMKKGDVDPSTHYNMIWGASIKGPHATSAAADKPPQDVEELMKYYAADFARLWKEDDKTPQGMKSFAESLRRVGAEPIKPVGNTRPNSSSDQVVAPAGNTFGGHTVGKPGGGSGGKIDVNKAIAQTSPAPDEKVSHKKAINLSEEQITNGAVDTRQNTGETSSS